MTRILSNASLRDHESAEKALKQALSEARFDAFNYHNDTYRWTATLVLFSGHDEYPEEPPPPYVRETGVTVGGINVTPRSSQRTILQDQIMCQATRVKCSASLRRDDGHETTFHHPDLVADPGKFFVEVHFGVRPAASDGSVEVFSHAYDIRNKQYMYKRRITPR